MLSVNLIRVVSIINVCKIYKLNFSIFIRSEKLVWYFGFGWFNLVERALKFCRVVSIFQRRVRLPVLANVNILIKDQVLIKNVKCSAASVLLCNYISNYDSEVVMRVKRFGGIVFGKTNMDEFGVGNSSVNSIHSLVANAWVILAACYSGGFILSGGSSGGSAVSLALSCTMLAIGTDTGGSVRQPACYNGLIGLKPTYGRCSRFGLISYTSSMEQVGILARLASDCSYLSSIIFGQDGKDCTSFSLPVPKYYLYDNCYKFEVIVLRRHIPCINLNWTYGLSLISYIGMGIREVVFKMSKYILPCYCILTSVECFSNLARYNSINYGVKFKESNAFVLYRKIRSVGYGMEVKRKLMTAVYILSSRLNYFKLYVKAYRIKFLLKSKLVSLMAGKLGFVLPTVPNVNLDIDHIVTMKFESDIYTILSNITGLPSINVPIGIDGYGVPFGVQIIGNAFDEVGLLSVCKRIQMACGLFFPTM